MFFAQIARALVFFLRTLVRTVNCQLTHTHRTAQSAHGGKHNRFDCFVLTQNQIFMRSTRFGAMLTAIAFAAVAAAAAGNCVTMRTIQLQRTFTYIFTPAIVRTKSPPVVMLNVCTLLSIRSRSIKLTVMMTQQAVD